MLVLGIESSCDDTAVAVVKNGRTVLSSKLLSQIDRHSQFGGVVPEIAAREHLKAIRPLFFSALEEANIEASDCDLIAVTQGPGLIGALLVGVGFAKGLASYLNKPLIPLDHVHAHVHGALLGLDEQVKLNDLFPCLALVVSGGHTNLYEMNSPCEYKLLASTADDACGECFDKVAKVLGLSYPGGPEIERRAQRGNPEAIAMPKMIEEKSRMQFSYSGLKTHVLNHVQKEARNGRNLDDHMVADICASFQKEALGHLVRKMQVAIETSGDHIRSLLVAGGVSANGCFRDLVAQSISIPTYFPKTKYCSDNAAMVASYGWHEYERQKADLDLLRKHDWDAYSRYQY